MAMKHTVQATQKSLKKSSTQILQDKPVFTMWVCPCSHIPSISWYIPIVPLYLIDIRSDCFKTDPLRGQNQLLSTLIHSYPLLSNSYPLLSNSYPTLIHSYSLLILRVMFFTLIHSCPLLSTLIHS